jgi:hypothetical protein
LAISAAIFAIAGIAAEEAGEDARRDEAVQRLLRALVGIVDEVRQRLQDAVEELGVEGHHELLGLSAGVVGPGQRGESQGARGRALHGHEPRLDQVQARGQHGQRALLAVGAVAGAGHDLDRHRAQALGRLPSAR